MNQRITFALLGGLAGVCGAVAIFSAIYVMYAGLAAVLSPEQNFNLSFRLLPTPTFRFSLINFSAGFIAVFIVAPFATRRLFSPQYIANGLTIAGSLWGAVAGLLCSWLSALIHIGLFTISGISSGRTEATLRWTLKLLGYYTSTSMLLFGTLAAAIGALSGAAIEIWHRHVHHQRPNGSSQNADTHCNGNPS